MSTTTHTTKQKAAKYGAKLTLSSDLVIGYRSAREKEQAQSKHRRRAQRLDEAIRVREAYEAVTARLRAAWLASGTGPDMERARRRLELSLEQYKAAKLTEDAAWLDLRSSRG